MRMRITITCHNNARYPGVVYATARDVEGNIVCSATLYYALSVADNRGYKIINAQEVLNWLQKNANFQAYPNTENKQ